MSQGAAYGSVEACRRRGAYGRPQVPPRFRRAWRPHSLSQRLRALLGDCPLGEPGRLDRWAEQTKDLDERLRACGILDSTDLADRLAHCRNVLSHGAWHLPVRSVQPAAKLLDLLVRLTVLDRLGFTSTQLTPAVERLTHES